MGAGRSKLVQELCNVTFLPQEASRRAVKVTSMGLGARHPAMFESASRDDACGGNFGENRTQPDAPPPPASGRNLGDDPGEAVHDAAAAQRRLPSADLLRKVSPRESLKGSKQEVILPTSLMAGRETGHSKVRPKMSMRGSNVSSFRLQVCRRSRLWRSRADLHKHET